MATATRVFTRTALHSSFRPTTAARGAASHFSRQPFRQQWQRRGYSGSASPKTDGRSSNTLFWLLGLGVVGGGGYFFYSQNKELFSGNREGIKAFTPKFEDYQTVYNAIAKSLEEHDEYEDGSYGPVVFRLSWHASGTYVEPSHYHSILHDDTNKLIVDTTKPPTPVVPTVRPCALPPNPNTVPTPAS